ncbi:hypothetical protein GpartN1_g4923.t1 [Galdieria partita]|uniref:Uncharacterized protein n=1 Tax=Galdieria partita TaxID=83374 RepID=A0A9C7US31_9RHOD|nr:hypothetical protein GpartN1_g4923.t1 [Galdieria partita]
MKHWIIIVLSLFSSIIYAEDNIVSVANVFLGTRQLFPVIFHNSIDTHRMGGWNSVDIYKEKWGFVMENNTIMGTIQQTWSGNGTQKLFTTQLELDGPTSGQLYCAELHFTKSGKEYRGTWQKKMDFHLQPSQDGCIVSKGYWMDSWCEGDYFFSTNQNGMWMIRVDDVVHNRVVFWYGSRIEQNEEWRHRVNKLLPPMIIIVAVVVTRLFRIYLIPKSKVQKSRSRQRT